MWYHLGMSHVPWAQSFKLWLHNFHSDPFSRAGAQHFANIFHDSVISCSNSMFPYVFVIKVHMVRSWTGYALPAVWTNGIKHTFCPCAVCEVPLKPLHHGRFANIPSAQSLRMNEASALAEHDRFHPVSLSELNYSSSIHFTAGWSVASSQSPNLQIIN